MDLVFKNEPSSSLMNSSLTNKTKNNQPIMSIWWILHNEFPPGTNSTVCLFVFFPSFYVTQCGPDRIWRLNTLGDQSHHSRLGAVSVGRTYNNTPTPIHTHTHIHGHNQNSLLCVKTCGLCHSNGVWQR